MRPSPQRGSPSSSSAERQAEAPGAPAGREFAQGRDPVVALHMGRLAASILGTEISPPRGFPAETSRFSLEDDGKSHHEVMDRVNIWRDN